MSHTVRLASTTDLRWNVEKSNRSGSVRHCHKFTVAYTDHSVNLSRMLLLLLLLLYVQFGESWFAAPETQRQVDLQRVYSNARQEAQLSPRDRAMRPVSWNLANCHATVQKLLVLQVLNQVSAVANWPVRQNRAADSAWRSVRLR